jgi:hypothetical protein
VAGNFAEVTYIDGGGDPPVAGEEREIRFSLLQHGVTPIDDGQVGLTLINADSGERLTVAATSLGDGLWTATVTFPTGGNWQVGVTHEWFETSVPIAIEVIPAEAAALAWLPAVLAVGTFVAVALVVTVGMLLARRREPAMTTVEEPAGLTG